MVESIQILIPTYNRGKDLAKNLRQLSQQIKKEGLEKQIGIIVSDNCSPDNTKELIEELRNEELGGLSFLYHRNAENIGLEKNAVKALSLATAPRILWLGDDDFIPETYLSFLMDRIQEAPELGCVIPGNSALHQDGSIKLGREADFDWKNYNQGFGSMLEIGHYSHQMSGIMLKREGLLEAYLQNESWRNVYLFIFFTNYCLLKYSSIYAPAQSVLITVFNQKDWKYDQAGLLPEMYKSYYMFEQLLSSDQIADLIFDVTRRHSWRFGIEVGKPLLSWKRLTYLVDHTQPIANIRKRLKVLFAKDYIYRVRDAIV